MDGLLRPMQAADLARVLSWRNQEHIRRNMYTQHVISTEEHQRWWQQQSVNPQTRLMIFELEDQPIGFVSFTQYSGESGSATWAFYSGDTSKKGIGRLMEYHALCFAFEGLKIRKLNCEVLAFNTAVIAMHQRYGFQIEGIFKEAYVRDGQAIDVYRLSMLSKQWFKQVKASFEQPPSLRLVGKVYEKQMLINAELVQQFAQVSDDFNPIHFDQDAAQQAGFKHQIAHGLLSVSFFSGIFGTQIDPQGLVYLSQSAEFLKPVYLDTQVTVRVEIIAHMGRQITAQTSVWQGEDQLLSGVAKLLLPKHHPSAALSA